MKLKIGEVSKFQKDGIYQVSIQGYDLIIISRSGCFYCLENRCSHEDFPLEDGDLEEHNGMPCVTCPAHGAKFSLEGKALTLPATQDIKKYSVSVEGESIFVHLV
ncbi:MAG: Rieske 2Fe-2S domain-containing protein [Deltaproteobacteria bacterium]|nr:Rieske 2Fe-2S domain-containing protein [Deltaproteobacteria bacterium]